MRNEEGENMDETKKPKKRTKPDCLNGYGDGPRHCTLEVGHPGICNHLAAHGAEAMTNETKKEPTTAELFAALVRGHEEWARHLEDDRSEHNAHSRTVEAAARLERRMGAMGRACAPLMSLLNALEASGIPGSTGAPIPDNCTIAQAPLRGTLTHRFTMRNLRTLRVALTDAPPVPPAEDAATPACPGPNCSMCSGESCNKCGAGCWNNNPTESCEHDVIDRHEGAQPSETAPPHKCASAPPVFTLEELEKAMRLASVGEATIDPALVLTMLSALRR